MSNSPKGATYRFLECTVSQYMTPAVQTVTRQVTLRDLEALFERHDFNAFPVVEEGKVLGIAPNSISFRRLPLRLVKSCPISMH